MQNKNNEIRQSLL